VRLVLDTNAAVSGLIWGGVPGRLIDAAAAIGPVILADPDDDIVLATAVAGHAEAIVSGDAHLLEVGEFRGIPIITPAVAADRLGT